MHFLLTRISPETVASLPWQESSPEQEAPEGLVRLVHDVLPKGESCCKNLLISAEEKRIPVCYHRCPRRPKGRCNPETKTMLYYLHWQKRNTPKVTWRLWKSASSSPKTQLQRVCAPAKVVLGRFSKKNISIGRGC